MTPLDLLALTLLNNEPFYYDVLRAADVLYRGEEQNYIVYALCAWSYHSQE